MPPVLNPMLPRLILVDEPGVDHADEVHNRMIRIQQLNSKLGSSAPLTAAEVAEFRALQEAAGRHMAAVVLSGLLRVPPAPA